MLYDNALLARLYTETYLVTRDDQYRRVAEETLDYLVREMRHPDGGFFSTQDADTDGQEGAFFVWSLDEVRQTLGADAALFSLVFDVTATGNFEGRTILHRPRSLTTLARVTGKSVETLAAVIERSRPKLLAVRERRPRPGRDEKVITAWNGLALRALAQAAGAFDRADYLALAVQNAQFLLERVRRADGRVLRRWTEPPGAEIPGYLEDEALLIDGLLALYRVHGDPLWLREARALADGMLTRFWDETHQCWYDTAPDHDRLPVRPRDTSDHATPSGHSVAVEVLLHLAALTDHDDYRERAEHSLHTHQAMLQQVPQAFGRLLCAADRSLAQGSEVVLVGRERLDPAVQALSNVVHQSYRPWVVVAYYLEAHDAALMDWLPLVRGRTMVHGQATAYVCTGMTCRPPVTEAEALRQQLDGMYEC